MAQHRLRELVKDANPVPVSARLLPQHEQLTTLFEEVMIRASYPQTSTGLLDATVERKRIMETEQARLRLAAPPKPPPRRRWSPVLVAAAAFAIGVIVGVAVLLVSQGSDDVVNGAPLTPLEVGEALNEATVTGDSEAMRLLYADEATITDVMGNPFAAFLEPSNFPNEVDWDGDGETTIFDEMLRLEATDYVAGVTVAQTCTQIDSTTVVCEEVAEGHAFLTDEARSTFGFTNTFTVEDGRITHQRFDGSPHHYAGAEDRKVDEVLLFEYRDWVVAKVGMEQRDLWNIAEGLTPETVERHRELIAEWVAER